MSIKWPSLDVVFRALNVPKKTDIDAVENRIALTVATNHNSVIRELKEHDVRVMNNRTEDRAWMEKRFDAQFQKLDDFIQTVLAVQSNRRHDDK